MPKEQNIPDSTAQEILHGASELFMRYGVKSITMDEIARHLSMSKKTIYQHFADKDELVNTFARESMEKQQCQILVMEKSCSNIMEAIMKLSEFLRSTVCNINPGLLFDLKKYFPKAWKVFQEHKKKFLKEHIIRTLRTGIEQGYFRKDLNLEVMARLRIEQIEMAFNPEIFPESEFNIKEVHMQLFQHFMLGICTLDGYEEFNKILKNN